MFEPRLILKCRVPLNYTKLISCTYLPNDDLAKMKQAIVQAVIREMFSNCQCYTYNISYHKVAMIQWPG